MLPNGGGCLWTKRIFLWRDRGAGAPHAGISKDSGSLTMPWWWSAIRYPRQAARSGISADVDDDLAEGAAVGHVPDRGRRVPQREPGADVRADPASGEQGKQFLVVAALEVRPELAERADLHALDGDALEQDEVQRDLRDDAGRVSEGHERAAPADGAQRLLGGCAADRVDDRVGAALGELADAGFQVFRGVVDDVDRPVRRAERQLLLARCRRDDTGAELTGD